MALVTDHWILVDTSKGTDPNPPFGHSHAGLWRICFYPVSSANTTTDDGESRHPSSFDVRCRPIRASYIHFFPENLESGMPHKVGRVFQLAAK